MFAMPDVFSQLEQLIIFIVLLVPAVSTAILFYFGCRTAAWYSGGVTTVLFVMAMGYVANACWYSRAAESGSLFTGSPLILGKIAYLLGLAIETMMILTTYLTNDWGGSNNSVRYREFLLRLIFLLFLVWILQSQPSILTNLFSRIGWVVTQSDVRSLLIPVLTALLAANLVEMSYGICHSKVRMYASHNSE